MHDNREFFFGGLEILAKGTEVLKISVYFLRMR